MRGLFQGVGILLVLCAGAADAASMKGQTLGPYLAGCRAKEDACARALGQQIEDARAAGEICLPAKMARAEAGRRVLDWLRDGVGENADFAGFSQDEAQQLALQSLWACR